MHHDDLFQFFVFFGITFERQPSSKIFRVRSAENRQFRRSLALARLLQIFGSLRIAASHPSMFGFIDSEWKLAEGYNPFFCIRLRTLGGQCGNFVLNGPPPVDPRTISLATTQT